MANILRLCIPNSQATIRTVACIFLNVASFEEGKGVKVPRESFLLRTDPKILEALRKWAEDELRSANGQLDFILRKALRDAGRLPGKEQSQTPQDGQDS